MDSNRVSHVEAEVREGQAEFGMGKEWVPQTLAILGLLMAATLGSHLRGHSGCQKRVFTAGNPEHIVGPTVEVEENGT